MSRRGFSLLELVTVLLILGVVAGVTVPRLAGSLEISPAEAAASELVKLLRRGRAERHSRNVLAF